MKATTMSMDLASALDLNLDYEQEAKFNALKTLQMKKIKQLMISIDAKDKEIAKMKILGKDNRRSQMIEALKAKIRTQETINDIIKEELVKRAEISVRDVNELIIRKTLGGPERFRPLTREELENKITDLEKKAEKTAKNGIRGVTGTGKEQADTRSDTKAASRGASRTAMAEDKLDLSDGIGGDNNTKMAPLIDEIQRLRMEVNAKDGLLDMQREDVVRLRARNAELVSIEEEADYLERQNVDLKSYSDKMERLLEDTTRKLADAMEASAKIRSDVVMVNENQQAEVVSLHKQCEKLLKQNAAFLQRISDMEVELENMDRSTSKSMQHSASAEAGIHSKEVALKAAEDKLTKTQEKLKQAESKCSSLEMELAKVENLKNQLRDKNIEINAMRKEIERKDERIASYKARMGVSASTESLFSNNADAKQSSPHRPGTAGSKG